MEITRCFNEAFSDYFMKFNATEQYLSTRWKIGRVNYEYSFGCFIDGKLRGFIVQGIDMRDGKLTAHNCATGIEPKYRGQGLLGELYDFAIPALKNFGVRFSTLEVISKNKRAIRGYEKTGFTLRPTLLHCFSGNPKIDGDENQDVLIKLTTKPNYKKYASFHDYEPTWEMTEQALFIFPEEFEYREMHLKNELVGYLIFAPKTNLVQQFAIHPEFRNMGFGKALFKNLINEYKSIRVVNVPETATSTVLFLNNIGLKNTIDQYEMEREI